VGQGDYQQAEMALERALKIEPRNPHYWFSMAQIKYKQKQYAQTIHLCSKSKSFAGKDEQLRQLNDALSAQAQQQIAH
jgi:Tfp pilus assembly protein PilF